MLVLQGQIQQSEMTHFHWNKDKQLSFDTLKEKLMNPPILTYADYNLPFKLHADASGTGLGAVLYQEQDGKNR